MKEVTITLSDRAISGLEEFRAQMIRVNVKHGLEELNVHWENAPLAQLVETYLVKNWIERGEEE